jgi:hypothetical protein
MRKAWVLDTETKGTGAHVAPLDTERKEPRPARRRARTAKPRTPPTSPAGKPRRATEVRRTPLPAGHVRRTTTGEIGRVLSVDARAGTARVQWLRRGQSSTVPLSAVSRR